MNRMDRLTAILLLLQERAHTSDEIARRFEVSKRTVLRDVQALSEMGVPVIAREGVNGGYSLPQTYHTPPLPLNSNEVFLLLLALSSINMLADAPFAGARASLLAKLGAAVPERQRAEAQALLTQVSLDTPGRVQRAPLLDALLQALRNKCWLRVNYQSATRSSTQDLFPRQLDEENGLWYLTAYSREHKADRRYRVDRLTALAALPSDHEEPPAALDYADATHPLIRVTLSARGASLAEGIADLAKHLARLPKGGAELTFRCPPSELAYYSRMLAGFGAAATVHEPEALRGMLKQLGRELLA